MTHREIWHEIHIKASPNEVYQAVTDIRKLAHWWTTDTRGESAVGKNLEFWFDELLGAEMGGPYGASIRSGVAPGEIICLSGTGPVGLGMTLFQT